jgi:competence protein ComGF
MEAAMGSNSTQGWALLVLLLAFTLLSISLFQGGSILFLLLAVVTMAGSIALFLKAKPLEDQP